jgi:hypothetical protein
VAELTGRTGASSREQPLAGQTDQVRTFSSEHGYPQPPSALLALWRDPAFLDAVGARFGGAGTPRVEESGDRVIVHSQRAIPMDKIPGFLRRFVKGGLLQQTDDWPRDADPPIEGTWTVTGSMPATMGGRHEVRESDGGCLVRVTGEVKVNAPLIGGRAEDLVAREITKLLASQQEFAAKWLAGERPAPAGA